MEYIKYFFILTTTLPLTLAGRVIRVGNPIVASNTSIDKKVIFLFGDAVPSDGILFAYSTYFCSNTTATFQVWRPVSPTPGNQKETLTLIHQQPVRAVSPGSAEDNYLGRCVLVKKGDRLGVFFNELPGAIGYTFSPNPVAARTTVSDTPEPFALGQSVTFDSLLFPYVFSAAAFIDTKVNKSLEYQHFPPCPQDVDIPPEGGDTDSTTDTIDSSTSATFVEEQTTADSGAGDRIIQINLYLILVYTIYWMS